MALGQGEQRTNKQPIASREAAREQPDTKRDLLPTISLPKGGGAIRGMGEKFAANPVTGTGTLTVPIATSPSRSGFGPQLSLSYDSGAGNGPFGFGWTLTLPTITRKTDKGLPQYRDAEESDVFILSGAEDLVPMLDTNGHKFEDNTSFPEYTIHRYLPRIEGLFARIERWTRRTDGDVHWRSFSKDNILTLYGKDDNSRIADPERPSHIFSWLLCETRDDKGNAVIYEYKAEDGTDVDLTQVQERNRGDHNSQQRKVNRYIKSINYGNRVSLLDDTGHRPPIVPPPALQNARWMFEVVFDYGEHDAHDPKPDDAGAWLCRHDPFSSYRAGFEVRTYRLCQRVLMFHHFPDEQGVGQNCLVHSTDFIYRDSRGNPDDRKRGNPLASFIASIVHSGYRRANGDDYSKKSLPPLELEYSEARISTAVQEIDAESIENLPIGLDGMLYQWVDLNGEGLSGILTEQADAWFYKPNLGDGKFGPLQVVASRPSLAHLNGGRQLLIDLAGDGRLDLVQFAKQPAGFFERTQNEDWESFVPFAFQPNVNWSNPNLKLLDLTGNGHADILIAENEVFTWYPSLAESGFDAAQCLYQATDEEHGPHLVFADGTQTIFLADMSGDQLTDLVRIRNGEVSYWPNLGYGRFGARVTMSNAPVFDSPDHFDPRRIRLADIDGSGTTDIFYLKTSAIQFWFNQAGNSWSDVQQLADFPHIDNLSSVQVVDLLGNDTACIVWSSPLPEDARQPMHYIDLMGGQKPHLLINTKNNLGAETHIQYAASTKFYLADKLAGKPWITRLPFPVHVVERMEALDHISRTRFVSQYTYHHGYFDGIEREFRGFGMVEQQDTEAFEDYVVGVKHVEGTQELDPELYQPPVTTRTWFHTGAFLNRGTILHQLQDEYYHKEHYTPEPILPAGLSEREYRECVRALKGLPLRQEVYSFDGSSQQQHPYSVIENNYDIWPISVFLTKRYDVPYN
jgi:Salmonella virulence plasmid 65kDa B protein/Insecticide toxin TcdB middle/N-terminal region/Insecticide toxin TcdB middle/C-terminal region